MPSQPHALLTPNISPTSLSASLNHHPRGLKRTPCPSAIPAKLLNRFLSTGYCFFRLHLSKKYPRPVSWVVLKWLMTLMSRLQGCTVGAKAEARRWDYWAVTRRGTLGGCGGVHRLRLRKRKIQAWWRRWRSRGKGGLKRKSPSWFPICPPQVHHQVRPNLTLLSSLFIFFVFLNSWVLMFSLFGFAVNDEYWGSLDRIGQLMSDLIMWRNVARSSLWFGLGSLLFPSSCFAKGINFRWTTTTTLIHFPPPFFLC